MAKIVNDLRSFSIKATEYAGKDGKRYIKLTGYPGVRDYLNATRYLANNPRIVSFGVGTLGIEAGIAQGARFGVAANTLLVSPLLAIGGSLMLVTLGVFAIGFLTSLALYWLDDHFKMSETVIKNIKNKKIHSTPYHPDQFLNMWGRFSRG
ncbi:hypothetical protein [Photorhabdus asymbiotica]|uniref:hypothetical protein n=1 Tax=Photorhabdus asymbiotica TaxID=291112 RepID=UPI003DA725AB